MSGALAIIPARGGSKRLPRKNVLPFRGKPMIAWTIQAARDSGEFDRVIVSTEDEEIAAVAQAAGAEVSRRPADLALDDVRLSAVMRYELTVGAAKGAALACMLMANCPLRTGADIGAARRLHENREAGVTMSVVGYDWRPPQWALREADGWLAFAVPQPEPGPLEKRERWVCPSGAIRWIAAEQFLVRGSFYLPRLAGFELPWHRAIDIDEQGDLEMARCVAFALDGGFAFAA